MILLAPCAFGICIPSNELYFPLTPAAAITSTDLSMAYCGYEGPCLMTPLLDGNYYFELQGVVNGTPKLGCCTSDGSGKLHKWLFSMTSHTVATCGTALSLM